MSSLGFLAGGPLLDTTYKTIFSSSSNNYRLVFHSLRKCSCCGRPIQFPRLPFFFSMKQHHEQQQQQQQQWMLSTIWTPLVLWKLAEEDSAVPQGLPPEPNLWEKYLISIAFVLGIVLTIGVVILTFAEWRNKRLREESKTSSGLLGKKKQESSPSSGTNMNRFARRLKRREDKLRKKL